MKTLLLAAAVLAFGCGGSGTPEGSYCVVGGKSYTDYFFCTANHGSNGPCCPTGDTCNVAYGTCEGPVQPAVDVSQPK